MNKVVSQYVYCYKCKEVTAESDLVPRGEWNPDIKRTVQYLDCPCGEQEDMTDAYVCSGCSNPSLIYEEDLCRSCWEDENLNDSDAQSERHERSRGIR